MAHLLRQSIIISALTVALAAIDPCSEVYPGLNVDFTTTQSKVQMTALSSCAGEHYIAQVCSNVPAAYFLHGGFDKSVHEP